MSSMCAAASSHTAVLICTHTHTHAWIRDLLCQCTSNSGFLFIGWESSILRLTTTDYRLLSSVSPLFLLPFPSVVPLCFTFSIHHLNFYQWGNFLPASRLFKTICCFLNLFTRLLFCHEGALMHRYTTVLTAVCSLKAIFTSCLEFADPITKADLAGAYEI